MTVALTYFSPKVEKRISSIQGRGLFAKENIATGEIVVVKGGHILTKQQRDDVCKTLGPSEIQITDDLFIGPTTQEQREGGMMHLNHSCDPNVGLQGQIVFIAMKTILADEELTFDYAMTDDEPDIEMKCNCGKPTCRRRITGKDWIDPMLQERYNGFFSLFIQNKIDRTRNSSK